KALALRGNLGATEEGRVFVDHQTWRFNVALQSAAGLKFAAFAREDVAFDGSADFDRFRTDLAFDRCVLADCQRSGRVDRPFNLAVDQKLVGKLNCPLNRDAT